ncbi:class I SAM-dependent methyltransferase, partial [Streptococcus gordonii]
IVLDPPSFARKKKQTFSVAKDYHKLIKESLEILNPRGILIASTNASNVSRAKFKKEIEKGFAGKHNRYIKEYGLPADFNPFAKLEVTASTSAAARLVAKHPE